MDLGDSKNKNPRSESSDRASDQRSGHSKPQVTPASGPTEPHSPQSPNGHKVPCKAQRDWHDYAMLIVQAVGVAFLIGYTTFAALQWCEMRRTNNLSTQALSNAKKQFERDQRPYVWPAEIVPFPLRVGEQIRANVFLVKYGKTPALREKYGGKVLVYVGKGTLFQADEFFENFDENNIVGGSEIIIPPGIPPDPRKSQAFSTAKSDGIIATAAGLNEIEKTEGSFAVVGVVVYFDAAGNKYRTDFCTMHLPGGLMAWCSRHNEIH